MWSRFIVVMLCFSVVLGDFRRHFSDVKDVAESLARIKRASTTNVIEVIVAVDQGMVDYYGDELYDVVASSMLQTSDVYENSNLKQSISLSLLDIIQLPMDPSEGADAPGTNGGKSADKMLQKYCDYVKSTTLKYDAAIYVTRQSIYTNSNPPSGINGLSYIGQMCTEGACLILSDSFIMTGWLAAHELGHSFGAQHDEDPSCSEFPMWDGKAIMQTNVGQSWNFSACTQNTMDKFFKSDPSKCLTENIGENKLSSYTRNENLFTVTRQCKEWLQDNFNVNAPFRKNAKDCKQMWCPRSDGNDGSNFAPWANGTPCGDNKECNHLKCVAKM